MPTPDPALIEDLRRRIRRLERAPQARPASGAVPLGVPAIDDALPWGGLLRSALNEVIAAEAEAPRTSLRAAAMASAAGFAAALLARAAGAAGTVLWCRRGPAHDGDLYGPGLAAFGLDPGRLIMVRGGSAADVLWVMEEGLRSGAPAAVLGEAGDAAGRISMTAMRRLQLAAETGGVMAVLLRPGAAAASLSAAATRWRVAAEPSAAGSPRWRLELLRCRGGRPRAWTVQWQEQPGSKAANDDRETGRQTSRHSAKTGGFVVAAPVRHRPSFVRPKAGHRRAG